MRRRDKARAAGCDDYVAKPFSPRQLLAKIREYATDSSRHQGRHSIMHDPPRILIVDDNETNRDILATRLATHGYELSRPRTARRRWPAATQHLPDLILLDVMMPKIDGIEVCRRLKSDAALPFMPIILVTAKADTKDVVAGLDAGADEYLTKPIDQARWSRGCARCCA